MKELLYEHKFRFFLYVLACLIPVVTDLMQHGMFALIFEAVGRSDKGFFYQILILAIGFIIISPMLFILSRMLRISYMRDTLLSIRLRAFDKIMKLNYKEFNKKSKDIYISNLINDINTFETKFFFTLINFIFRTGLYITSLTILFFIDYRVGLFIFGVSILILGISKLFERKTIHLQKEVSAENENFTLDMANTFNGLEILKLNNIEDKFLLKSQDKIKRLEGKKFQFNFFTQMQLHMNISIGYFILMALMMYVLTQVNNGMSYGVLFLTVQLGSACIFPLVDIFPLLNVLKSSKAIYEKITSEDFELTLSQNRTQPFELNNAIEIRDLSYSYEDQQVFKSLNFKIEKGKKYLIKGPSGVGKSTLMKLLSMAYDDYEGQIIVDGVDYQQINFASFNNQVSYIYQDVFLFEASIKDNIALFKDIDEALILKAIKQAGLETFISNKERGIADQISENGKNLSGGERQRISIARALAKDSEILFVDEATSALNEDLGRSIEETILDLDKTVIAISHRYYDGVTNHYDYVLELKDGFINQYTAKDYFEGDE